MASDPEKLNYRLVLLGSVGTGKTSILNRFLFGKYVEKYRPTVEDLFTKDFDLGTLVLRVDFLDTSGSMQFPAMRRLSITTGSAFLIVYAVDDLTSFEVAKQCIEEIQETRSDYQEIPIVFAGNKCDIPLEQRLVKKEDISNYVFCELPRLRAKVIECSCKDDINTKELFKAYLNLARISISTMATDGTLKRRSSAHASGKWRLGGFSGLSSDSGEKSSSNSSLTARGNGSLNTGSNNGNGQTNQGNSGQNNNNHNNNTNCSNCNKTTVALIKSVTDATNSTINRVGRTLTGSAGPSTPTHLGGPNQQQQQQQQHHHGQHIGNQSPRVAYSSQDNIVISEDTSGPHHNHDHQQQQQVVATRSQPISAHLSLNQRIKPRSRSLMRRSTRKSKVRDQDDISQCLPS